MKSIFLHLVILTSVISLASCSSTDSVLNTDADITVLRIGDEELLLGFAKRYIGWIGVGYMLYEFGTCVNNGQQS